MPDNLTPELANQKAAMQVFVQEVIDPAEQLTNRDEAMQRVRDAAKAHGLFGKTQPEAYGGSPAGTLELTMLREQLAAANSAADDGREGNR